MIFRKNYQWLNRLFIKFKLLFLFNGTLCIEQFNDFVIRSSEVSLKNNGTGSIISTLLIDEDVMKNFFMEFSFEAAFRLLGFIFHQIKNKNYLNKF